MNNAGDLQQLVHFQRKIVREDFASFISMAFAELHAGRELEANWHVALIGEYLQAVERGEITRLLVNCPPRYLKSFCISVAWPAWLLGQTPAQKVIVASYAAALSEKHSLDCRQLLQSPWYKASFADTRLMSGQNEKRLFSTTENGMRMAASVCGVLTGYGGDILIVDDPLNPARADSPIFRNAANRWFDQTFSTRLNSKRDGKIVVVMQRLHHEDLSGYLLAKGGWEQLVLPVIGDVTRHVVVNGRHFRQIAEMPLHPAREDQTTLNRLRHEIGSLAFAAQYLQQPRPLDGGLVQPGWISRYVVAPNDGLVVQSWDTAIKTGDRNDYSACCTFRLTDECLYLTGVMQQRLDYPALKREIAAWGVNADAVLIEDKASGQSLLQDLRWDSGLPLIACMPLANKTSRLAAVSPLIESGRVKLPHQADWLADFEKQLFAFPHVQHDDLVDAFTQALEWFRARSRKRDATIRRL